MTPPCGVPFSRGDQLAVLLLRWRFQPPLDVEDHPLLLRVFLHRPHQQIVVDIVEEALDVQVQTQS